MDTPETLACGNSTKVEDMTYSHTIESPIKAKPQERPEIPRRVVKYWILSCIGFIILAPLLSILLGFFVHTKDLAYTPTEFSFSRRTLTLEAILVSADPQSSIITFDWGIIDDTGPCTENCTDVNIFFDDNLLVVSNPDSNATATSSRPSKPLFRYSPNPSQDIRANSATFRTNIRLFVSGKKRRSALINYPFDTYGGDIFMFAEDASTNDKVALLLSSAVGNAVGFKTTFTDRLPETNDPDVVLISIDLVRGGLIIAFCVIITVSVWLITLVLFILSFTAVVFGFRQRTEVLLIPVATIFTFTQLRSSMPGAPPGFGDVLDFIGLLPCLGILTFSSALTLGALLFRDPTNQTELTWDKIQPEILPALGLGKKRHAMVKAGSTRPSSA